MMRRTILAVLLAPAVLAAACGNGGGGNDSGATDEYRTEVADVCGSGDTPGAKAILECLTPSLAFVETPLSTGSGILLTDGMVVTNAHVIDPYSEVDIALNGGERHDGVDVALVDPLADIALLGPIDTTLTGTEFAADVDVERGDDVFLVGFPGESDAEADPAISQGILSRVREADEFDQTYLQTDAAIGGGQSGGALVDARGRVIGVSGLRFAEEFALALSADDVEAVLGPTRSGTSLPYRPFPTDGGVTEGSFVLRDAYSPQVIAIPAAPEDRTVRLTLPPDLEPLLKVNSLLGDVLFVNQPALDAIAEFQGTSPSELGLDPDEAVQPGVFEFDLPADEAAVAYVGTRIATGATMTFTASTPVHVIADDDTDSPIAVGDRVDGTIDILDTNDTYVVNLQAGDKIEIFVGSPSGDMAFSVRAPGETLADAFFADDTGEGLLGYDARDVFEAEQTGAYTIGVHGYAPAVVGYGLSIEEAP